MEYLLNYDILVDETDTLRIALCAILDAVPWVRAMSLNLGIYEAHEGFIITQTEYDYLVSCVNSSNLFWSEKKNNILLALS
jgi:hypothetical protein